jgi:hypothetical protein
MLKMGGMMRRLACLGIGLLVLLGNLTDLRAQSGEEPQALFQKVLTSTLQNDYAGLISVCDQGMKEMVTEDMLTDLSRSMGLHFKSGYTPTYMGYLDKAGARVYYWKLSMKDRGDDVLMTLVVRQGLVSAFNLK